MTLSEDFKTLFLRNLEALQNEILQYPDSHLLWKELPGTANSGGTLTLHLTGNLRHFIGAILGGSGFVRNRESEFSLRGLSSEQLITEINNCRMEVTAAFDKITSTDFDKKYPLTLGNIEGTTLQILLHLAGHFNYHLGQVNYHRRIAINLN